LSIEAPSYFKVERFNSFAEWIAVILEENLWANFNYWKAKTGTALSSSGVINFKRGQNDSQTSKHDSHKISLQSFQNLFELKDIEEQFGFTVPSHKVHTLANSWINAPLKQKKGILDTLKNMIHDRQMNKTSQSVNEKGTVLQLKTNGNERSSSSSSAWQPGSQRKSVNLHLQNQRFDSQQQTLLIDRNVFEEIEKTSLSVHNPMLAKDLQDAANNAGRGKKQKAHQKNKKSKSGLSAVQKAEDLAVESPEKPSKR
jgi:hypothetical protein